MYNIQKYFGQMEKIMDPISIGNIVLKNFLGIILAFQVNEPGS